MPVQNIYLQIISAHSNAIFQTVTLNCIFKSQMIKMCLLKNDLKYG